MNIYHRIYKLHLRKVPAQQIAVTTNMPLKSVRAILKKFTNKANNKDLANSELYGELEPYLDCHTYKQHKYTIIDLSGFLIKHYFKKVKEVILDTVQYSGSLIALKLESILDTDIETLTNLADLATDLQKNGKTIVLFAPSDKIEEVVAEAQIEDRISILGTQGAFDEYLYRITHRG